MRDHGYPHPCHSHLSPHPLRLSIDLTFRHFAQPVVDWIAVRVVGRSRCAGRVQPNPVQVDRVKDSGPIAESYTTESLMSVVYVPLVSK